MMVLGKDSGEQKACGTEACCSKRKRMNDVTLFSNGIGHFRRVYKVPAQGTENVSIPFKRDHIGDVAASLQVFGAVRLVAPPSFTPSNANATALEIDQEEAMLSLLTSLSGAQVKVERFNGFIDDCVLLGVDTEMTVVERQQSPVHFACLMQDGKLFRLCLKEIKNISFEEESVRTEIQKALKNNFQKIKPDSTLLDISMSALGDEETEAVVQYTIPVASWKMRYAIRQDKDKFLLEGAAIIDNNTDEDWDNFRLSVVTGNPISFATDIATVCMPTRKFVKLVDGSTQGNVSTSEVVSHADYGGRPVQYSGNIGVAARSCSPKMSVSNVAHFGMEAAASPEELMYAAEAPGVESKEVGDFCVFTSKEPVTVLARKSAVVPMFTVPLSRAGVVLFYNESNHARRPYRAIKFKNETEYFLGRGKTVIYNEGVFSGECVLENTKPGENRMLPHCLENGVRVIKELMPAESRRTLIKLSDGVAVTEDVLSIVTKYTIENKKAEQFKMALEHQNNYSDAGNIVDFSGVSIKEREKLADTPGYRVYFELQPNEAVVVEVTETVVSSQRVTLGCRLDWIQNNLLKSAPGTVFDDRMQDAIVAQNKIDEIEREIATTKKRKENLTSQSDRVQKMLTAAKDVGGGDTVAKWVNDLDSTERAIREIDQTTLPMLTKNLNEAREELGERLKRVTVCWKPQ